ncbi:uncharacterized protein LOC142235675 [Haematobia irritans]|uniref:uncharacterized protein LOC142235675 n=1 Tax=Haematobia irritans TaxID=7368 RepID=UPI003F4F80BF
MKIIFICIFCLVYPMVNGDNKTPKDDQGDGIQCYECDGSAIECFSLGSFKTRFNMMTTCKTGCAVMLGPTGEIGLYDITKRLQRGCDDMEVCHTVGYHCCTCNFNGCNINNRCDGVAANFLSMRVILSRYMMISSIMWFYWTMF